MLRRPDWHNTRENKADATLEAVFGEIYRKHERALYRLVLRVTRSEQQSQDIVQEVFIKLWEHRGEIGDIRNMEDWLYRVTENKMMDFLRKAAADSRLREALWIRTKTFTRETEESLQAKECHSIIQGAVSRLPRQRKLIFHLNREEGLNHQEIAEVLSISRHTVKNQLASALRSIQRLLTTAIILWVALFW